MPEIIDINMVKTRFAKILARVHAGEEIIIAVNGRPNVRLVKADA